MEGWSEEEVKDKNLMAPCGLYCGACGVYIATRDKNEKFREVMATFTRQRRKTLNVTAACKAIRRRSFTAIAPCARSGIASGQKVSTHAINAASGPAA